MNLQNALLEQNRHWGGQKIAVEYIDSLNPHYQLPRYPDIRYKGPILRYNKKVTREYFDKTKQVFLWIEKKITLRK